MNRFWRTRRFLAGHVRTGLVILTLLCGGPRAWAQDTTRSLTQDFPKLSAKERARIAAREAEESKQDQAYQELMRSGEKAFQEGHYEEAMHLFEQARTKRPYNVYPKVKIEDLKALMARQSAGPDEPASSDAQGGPMKTAGEGSTGLLPTRTAGLVPVEPGAQQQTVTSLAEQPAVERGGDVAHAVMHEATPTYSLKKAEGVIERRYKDGRAFVIERVVTVDGRTVVYKRVYHPFGQVFFFEDGLSVDERVWKARFQ
jgi:hypothetical protein